MTPIQRSSVHTDPPVSVTVTHHTRANTQEHTALSLRGLGALAGQKTVAGT